MNELKLKPFNIEAIKAGAKCVTKDRKQWILKEADKDDCGTDAPYRFENKDLGSHWFTYAGDCFTMGSNFSLFILDETPTPEPTMNEPTYRLLNIGEEILPSDETFIQSGGGSWVKTGCSGEKLFPNHQPHRRLIPSPWIRYEDRKPTREDGVFAVAKEEQIIANMFSYDTYPIFNFTHWMPIPPLPKPKRDFQRDILDKWKGTAAEQLWNLLDDKTQNSLKAGLLEDNV